MNDAERKGFMLSLGLLKWLEDNCEDEEQRRKLLIGTLVASPGFDMEETHTLLKRYHKDSLRVHAEAEERFVGPEDEK